MSSKPSLPIRVGFCGYGYSTRTFHLPFVLANPRLAVHAFLQRSPKPTARGKPASSAKEDYPDAKVYDKAEDFFADKDIDLVVVATGHDSHADLAVAALEAGKHVIVEKCFTLSSAEADRVIAAQKKAGGNKVLTVFQNRRYDSDYRTLAHLIKHPEQPLGKLAEVEFHYDVNGFWMKPKDAEHHDGQGMMFGIGCHVLDQALALFGRPATVTGFYRCQHGESKEDDNYTLILQYEGELKNLTVTVKTNSVNVMTIPLKYFARGLGGTYIKFGEDPQEPQVGEGMTPASKGYGFEPPSTYGTLTTLKQFHPDQTKEIARSWVNQDVYEGKFPSLKGDYSDYYEDVVKAIMGEGPVVITPQHARDGLRIIELGRKSADEGKTLKMD